MGAAVLLVAIAGASGCAPGSMHDTGTFEQQIIGGETAEPGEFPATGALVRGLRFTCTATLIAPDVVVTAAHCLGGDGWGDFGFTLEEDLTKDVSNVVPAMITHQYPDFRDSESFPEMARKNDVGVVILEEPILGVPIERLDSDDDPIDLATGTELQLCGYGRDSWSIAKTAGRKRDADVVVDLANYWELQTLESGPQPCRGDSGGPVFAETPYGRRLVGIVSRAIGDSHKCDSGAIYTRVAQYSDWIREAAQDREEGCAVGSRTGSSAATWSIALLAVVLAHRRRRR
jgi:secreted trypsin-like serine protease